VTDQDAHIAGYILESGRAVVLAVNKWDAVDDYQRELVQRSIETRLAFLKFANAALHLGQKAPGSGSAVDIHCPGHKAATCKMSTPVLTRAAAGGGAVPERPSAPACSAPSCATPTRAA
jgi:GTP-binding protein